MLKQKAKVTVLKFGSSVLRSEADLPSAVHEIYRHWREGAQVIAVVSAFGDTTDQLMRRAESVCAEPVLPFDCFDIFDFRTRKTEWNQWPLINYHTGEISNRPRSPASDGSRI